MRKYCRRGMVVVSALGLLVAPGVGSPLLDAPRAGAIPAAEAADADEATVARVISSTSMDPQETTVVVYSPSMDRVVPLTVLHPRDASRPAPTLYLLNGAGGGEDAATWAAKTRYKEFFADKHVNVVTPIGGAFSYYTDWERDDPELGRNKWQTFLTEELPPLIDREFSTTGANAVAGISMAGTSVLNLAIAAPKLYRSVAAYSGCARTSDPLGQAFIRTVVGDRGGADITNMWGPLDGPGWRANDPYLNAERLRDTKVYLTTGTGLPGEYDTLSARLVDGDLPVLANQILMGGVIEAIVHQCTMQMAQKLDEIGSPAQLTVRPAGTHSWEYWEEDLRQTWPSIAADLAD